MKTLNIENVLYQFRYEVLEDEVRAKIPNRPHIDRYRPVKEMKDNRVEKNQVTQQILYRGGMIAIVGILYYLVTIMV